MKKLTALIALVLMLSVSLFVLSSCGGDKAESKAESKTESKATSKTESKAESKAESKEESQAVSEEESKPDIFTYDIDRTKTKTNVAAGKTYEVVAGEFSPNYLDEEGKTLTDGAKAAQSGGNFSEAIWTGIETGDTQAFVIDLGEKVEAIADFEAYLFNDDASAIRVPLSMTISVSEDGTNFVEAGKVVPSKDDITFTDGATTASYIVKIELEKGVKAQYVKFEFVRDGWLFTSELEVSVYK